MLGALLITNGLTVVIQLKLPHSAFYTAAERKKNNVDAKHEVMQTFAHLAKTSASELSIFVQVVHQSYPYRLPK